MAGDQHGENHNLKDLKSKKVGKRSKSNNTSAYAGAFNPSKGHLGDHAGLASYGSKPMSNKNSPMKDHHLNFSH